MDQDFENENFWNSWGIQIVYSLFLWKTFEMNIGLFQALSDFPQYFYSSQDLHKSEQIQYSSSVKQLLVRRAKTRVGQRFEVRTL